VNIQGCKQLCTAKSTSSSRFSESPEVNEKEDTHFEWTTYYHVKDLLSEAESGVFIVSDLSYIKFSLL